MMAYYNAFKYLVPFEDTTSEDAGEPLMEILQNHYVSRPHHHTTTEHEEKTYDLLLDDTELGHYKASMYQNIKLDSSKQGLMRAHQHLHVATTLNSVVVVSVQLRSYKTSPQISNPICS